MSFSNYASHLNNERSLASQEQLRKFQELLNRYAPLAPGNEQLRLSLLQIARNLGIDPLTLPTNLDTKKERENKVSVLCVDVCSKRWAQQGGSVQVAQVQSQINSILNPIKKVSIEETSEAVKKLDKLGPGFRVETLPTGVEVIRNALTELSRQQGDVLAACDVLGYVTVDMLIDNFRWSNEESLQLLESMLSEGLLWIDQQSSPTSYWVPSAI